MESCIEKMNFKQLITTCETILIPKIQRDYAQGRSDLKAESVRHNLLKDIFTKDKTISFDFIFGTKRDNDFVPLDGQQRLTTLFLLYLYDKCVNKNQEYAEIELQKFTYDTRRAAKDFCKEITSKWLVNKDAFKNDSNEWKPSTDIKNNTWFMDYWQYDPTVESMLTMLDAIHKEKCKEEYFPKLDDIYFYFFDMKENNLDETLYLKMNSRGKPLTSFENIKAEIDQILPSFIGEKCNKAFVCLDNEKPSGENFSEKWKFFIDRDWAEFFWKYKNENNLIDSAFIRFISNSLACYYAVNCKKINNKDVTIEQITKKNGIFLNLLKINGEEYFVDFTNFKKVFDINNEDAFFFLARTISIFTKFEENIIKYTKPTWNRKFNLCREIICSTPDDKVSKERAVFFAVSVYPETDFDKTNFSHWMRVIWNIVENANLNGVSELWLIYDLSQKLKTVENHDIYNVLTSYKQEEITFARDQLEEEIKKAEKIKEKQEWEDKFIDAEKYAFFKGAIRFLFRNPNGELNDWDNFDIKWGNAQKYFDEDGVSEAYKINSELLKNFLCRVDISNKWFGNDKESWHAFLLRDTYKSSIHYLLTTTQLKLEPNCDDWITDRNLLPNLLSNYSRWHILNDWRNYSVLTLYSRRESNPHWYDQIVVLDNNLRKNLLHQKDISIEDDNKVRNTKFLYGWDINFNYPKNGNPYSFQWSADDYVYLMNEEKRTNKRFRVTKNMQPPSFLTKLDELIDQYKKNK